MPTNADMLAGVPLFALLDEAERAALAERLDVLRLDAGKNLFHRGDPGDSGFIVKSGAVEIYFKSDAGERIVLETAREGDFFGEISLIDGGPRTASAVVMEDLEALVVDRGDLDEFFRLKPAAAMDLLTAAGKRLRETTRLLRNTVSRNVNREEADHRSGVMKVADWISEFSGSLPFLFLHCVIFFVWIALNAGPLTRSELMNRLQLVKWDTDGFALLTMSVSLEAIILSVFVLLSQNRQASRDRVRNDVEYETNVRAELEIMHLHEKLDSMNEQILASLQKLERAAGK